MIGKFNITLKKEIPSVLIHTDSHYDFHGEETFNLILSPAFYWCKKERVGVKSLSAARAIARSVFDGNIPAGEYKYLVQKSETPGEFLFFAYDEDSIVERLKELGVPLNRVAAIHFAQNEFKTLETPLKISDKTALIVTDGIVSAIPTAFAPDAVPPETDRFALSRHKIPIRTYNSLGIKASRVYTLSAAGALFAVIFFVEYRYYSQALENELARKSTMLKEAGLPTTSFQLESIKKSLTKRAEETRKLKETIASLTAVAKEKASPIQSLQVSEKSVSITYTAKNSQPLQAALQKSHPKAKLAQSGETITLEVNR